MRLDLSELTTSLQPHEQSLIDDRLAGLRASDVAKRYAMYVPFTIQDPTLNCLNKVKVLTEAGKWVTPDSLFKSDLKNINYSTKGLIINCPLSRCVTFYFFDKLGTSLEPCRKVELLKKKLIDLKNN